MRSSALWRAAAAAGLLACATLSVQAQNLDRLRALSSNLLTFTTSAQVDVVKDWLTMSLAVTREGSEPAAVQTQLKQVLEAALAEARRQAQPGAMEVRTGAFNVSPRYGKDGRISGWQGTAELVLDGRDAARIASTAGRLTQLAVTGAQYSISREQRDKVDAELTAQAIAKFRQRATEMASQFGFTGYALREVSVQGAAQEMPVPMMKSYRSAMADAAAAMPVPTEPGTGLLSATVQGTVELTR